MLHQSIEDLSAHIRKGVWAADELMLSPASAQRVFAQETLTAWLNGEEPQYDEAVLLLAEVTEQLAKWERIQEAVLGVAVRMRPPQEAGAEKRAEVR